MYKKTKNSNPLSAVMSAVGTTMTQNVGKVAAANFDSVLSSGLESLTEEVSGNIQKVSDDNIARLRENLTTEDSKFQHSDAGLEAAAVLMSASDNLTAYQSRALNTNVDSVASADFVTQGSTQGIDSRLTAGVEAFDNDVLSKSLNASIAFAISTAAQDPFGEALFKTKVLPADVSGFVLEINQDVVMKDITRSADGSVTDFQKTTLIEARVDSDILKSTTNKIIPWRLADDSRNKFFATEIADKTIEHEGVEITTAPLKFGVRGDLMSLITGPGGIGSTDQTDQIANGARLANIYIRVAAADDSAPSLIKFDVANQPTNSFSAANEGESRDTVLNFDSEGLVLTSATLATNQSVAPHLVATIPTNYKVYLRTSIFGKLNLDKCVYNLNVGELEVAKIKDGEGNVISLNVGDGKDIVDALKLTDLGFDFNAQRTNTNHRTLGFLAETKSFKEQYKIKLCPPVSAIRPVDDTDSSSAVRTLSNIQRAVTSNNAVAKILGYADHLETRLGANTPGEVGEPGVEGIVGKLIRPLIIKDTIDFTGDDVLNNMREQEKDMDVQSRIVNVIRNKIFDLDRGTNYSTLLESLSPGHDGKLEIIVATDDRIPRYLMVDGEEATFGKGVSGKVVQTANKDMYGKIIIMFADSGIEAVRPGTRVYVPELTTVQQRQRGDTSRTEISVQPREELYNHVPAMIVLDVLGLEDPFVKKV